MLTAEVLNSETHPAKLDCIEFLDFVVKFTLRVLEGSDHEPEAIYGLFFSVRVSVLDIETLCNDEGSWVKYAVGRSMVVTYCYLV